jgi:ABC-type transport system substrate-binding protein
VPPGVEGRLETPFAYGYNLEKAKRLIAEAGYPDGIDPKTGRRLVISVSVGRANQEVREEIELLQSFYGKIGIKLEPRYMTWDAFLQAVNEGRTTMFMMGWVGDYPDAENFLQLFHTKNFSPGANHGCYSNPEFDALYDKAMAAGDSAERLDYWRKAQEILREDCPWVFLSHTKRHALAWDHVGNYIPSDFPYGMEKHYYVRESAKEKGSKERKRQ